MTSDPDDQDRSDDEISDEEIIEWAKPPDEFRLSWTEAVLRDALRYSGRLDEHPYEVFLQGSYANHTNITESSDVDLVVMLTLPFEENVAALDPNGLKNFVDRYEDTWYGWEEFREDVLASLRESYFVAEGNKCVDIRDWDSLVRVPADIVPTIEYRLYSAFPTPQHEVYEEGVFFRDRLGHPIVNSPNSICATARPRTGAPAGISRRSSGWRRTPNAAPSRASCWIRRPHRPISSNACSTPSRTPTIGRRCPRRSATRFAGWTNAAATTPTASPR